MAKRLEMTPRLRELISRASVGVTPDDVVAFESISINTLPVSKRNLFEGAVHVPTTLQEMADFVNNPDNHVPLHNDHDQGYALPVGKTFYGQVVERPEVNYSELRTFFYLPKTEVDLISKIETNTVSEVSIGARYKHLNCSECGWDFLGEDADEENIWSRVCKNEHQIGVKGVHLRLNGLDTWLEQSLVSRGAAKGAKIVARTQALLGADTYNQLAASGRNPGATTLYASATTPPPEKPKMDLTELIKELTDVKAKLSLTETKLADTEKRVSELLPLEARVVELTAANDALKDVQRISDERTAAFSFTLAEAKRLAIAAGETPPPDTSSLTDLVASISANRLKVADRFYGGRTPDADPPVRSKSGASAFKLVR